MQQSRQEAGQQRRSAASSGSIPVRPPSVTIKISDPAPQPLQIQDPVDPQQDVIVGKEFSERAGDQQNVPNGFILRQPAAHRVRSEPAGGMLAQQGPGLVNSPTSHISNAPLPRVRIVCRQTRPGTRASLSSQRPDAKPPLIHRVGKACSAPLLHPRRSDPEATDYIL